MLRGPFRPGWSRRRLAALAVALALAFALFPPLSNEGPTPAFGLLDRTLKLAFPDPVRVLVFYALALLAVLRFSDFTLESACVLIYALLMAKAHLAWDKYALPVLLVLWWIAALESSCVYSSRIGKLKSQWRSSSRMLLRTCLMRRHSSAAVEYRK